MKHYADGERVVHMEGSDGVDYTLCGQALEAWDNNAAMEITPKSITCERCIGIIRFCKVVREGEIAPPFERRSAVR